VLACILITYSVLLNVALGIMSQTDRTKCKLVVVLLLQNFQSFLFEFKVVSLMDKNVHKVSF